MSSPTPDSSPASSSTSLANGNRSVSGLELDEYSSDSSTSSASSTPSLSLSRSRSPLRSRKPLPTTTTTTTTTHLAPPPLTHSRSPSPLSLIPIHRTFTNLIHTHEVPRKLLHVSIGFLVLYLYRTGHQPSSLTPPLTLLLLPIASADVLRFYNAPFNSLYIRLFGALMRESEVQRWNGVVWYLVGSITVLTFFPKDVATLSILLLSWCDTAASTVGRACGAYTPRIRRGKSLAGSVACAVVGAFTAAGFWGLVVPSTGPFLDDPVGGVMWRGVLRGVGGSGGGVGGGAWGGGWALAVMSVVTGVIAGFSEAVDVFGLDDNVVIPVLSAAGIWGVLKLLG